MPWGAEPRKPGRITSVWHAVLFGLWAVELGMAQNDSYKLLAHPGTGAAIVEACLTLAGLPFVIEDVDYEALGPGSAETEENPLGQVPTLLLPDGSVMTESLAMVLHIHDCAPEAGLLPASDDTMRPMFLRWLVFMVAAIYPTFTFGDDPSRWVGDGAGQKMLKARTDASREGMWRQVEEAVVGQPWFLGEGFSALDVYVTMMTQWEPRRAWFAAHCPKISDVAKAGGEIDALQAVWARNNVW